MEMDPRVRVEIEGLERRAAMYDGFAAETRSSAVMFTRLGSYSYLLTVEKAEKHEREAQQCRDRAAQLRRQHA